MYVEMDLTPHTAAVEMKLLPTRKTEYFTMANIDEYVIERWSFLHNIPMKGQCVAGEVLFMKVCIIHWKVLYFDMLNFVMLNFGNIEL